MKAKPKKFIPNALDKSVAADLGIRLENIKERKEAALIIAACQRVRSQQLMQYAADIERYEEQMKKGK